MATFDAFFRGAFPKFSDYIASVILEKRGLGREEFVDVTRKESGVGIPYEEKFGEVVLHKRSLWFRNLRKGLHVPKMDIAWRNVKGGAVLSLSSRKSQHETPEESTTNLCYGTVQKRMPPDHQHIARYFGRVPFNSLGFSTFCKNCFFSLILNFYLLK